jgi:hypothetical protein
VLAVYAVARAGVKAKISLSFDGSRDRDLADGMSGRSTYRQQRSSNHHSFNGERWHGIAAPQILRRSAAGEHDVLSIGDGRAGLPRARRRTIMRT